MNLLWITNVCPFPIDNGGKVVIANRIRELSKYNDIYLVIESSLPKEAIENEIKQICYKYWIVSPEEKNIYVKVWEYIKYSRNLSLHRNKSISLAIKECVEKYSIDMMLFELPMAYVNYISVKEYVNDIPIIINQHNVEFDNVRSKIHIKEIPLALKMYAVIESRKLKKFEKIISRNNKVIGQSFVSANDMNLYKNVIGRKTIRYFVSPIGTHDVESHQIKEEHNQKNIVYVASLDYGPNIHGAQWFCEKVMPMIRESVSNVSLYLVGKNPSESVKKLAQGDVIVTGSVPDVSPFYSMADLIVVPIFYGGGVKTKLIEAGCFGKPVVSTDQGRKGTKYRDGIDLLIANDAYDFGKKCIDVLNNTLKYNEMGYNMRLITKKLYMWEAIGEEYNKNISKILAEYINKQDQN